MSWNKQFWENIRRSHDFANLIIMLTKSNVLLSGLHSQLQAEKTVFSEIYY